MSDLTSQQEAILTEGICPLCGGEVEFVSANLWQCQQCGSQYELVAKSGLESVSANNPIKIFPDGDMWCALLGEDLQAGQAAFAETPRLALLKLLAELDQSE